MPSPTSLTAAGRRHPELEMHVGHRVTDPLSDVLDWLGYYKPKEEDGFKREDSEAAGHSGKNGHVQEPLLDMDVSEESIPHRPVHVHTFRHRRPNMDDRPAEARATVPKSQTGPGRPSASPPVLPMVAAAGLAAAASSRPPSKQGRSGENSAWCAAGKIHPVDERTSRDLVEEEEEEEWEMRKRKSGTVGRLVMYCKGDRPREDVVLRGGGRRQIVVAGVREGGQASRAGVRAGDRLVSIDGHKNFLGLNADAVRDNLVAPTVLVFLGFVGKLRAEVRLTASDTVCGVAKDRDLFCGGSGGPAPVHLCEERVFDVGIASLFLTVGDKDNFKSDTAPVERVPQPAPADDQLPLFELQRSEAHQLVRRALHRRDLSEALGGTPAGEVRATQV